MKKLYFGDNFEIMREMDTGAVDLICTDPPFNSGRNYNAFFKESKAQNKAFTDIWTWDTEAKKARAEVENPTGVKCDLDTYKALNNCLEGYDQVLQNAVSGNKGAMRAYLAFMGPRLAEMHRILKDTGSIYLHCDPTASHYLKGMMDAIWDQHNRKKNDFYRNEIVWCYTTASTPHIRQFVRCTDSILFYSKGKKWTFNRDDVRIPYKDGAPHGGQKWATDEEELSEWRERKAQEGKIPENWWPIPKVGTSKENLDYPTQKPLALYERMILASSHRGELVFDPFAGCGTTIDAAETHKRLWIGIDLTIIALDPMRRRLRERHGLELSKHYEIEGYPTNMQEVHKFLKDGDKDKYHDFSNWAVTRLGLTPTPNVRDGGKDGVKRVTVWNPQGEGERQARILAEVKSGGFTKSDVRAFCRTMDKVDAIAGIFITIEPPSDGMRQEAADMGKFSHNNTTYPRLQFWQIDDDYFNNDEIVKQILQLPPDWLRPIHKSERHFEGTQMPIQIDQS